MSVPDSILVIKLSALGDMVLALAAMQKIRAAHPGAHITLLTTPPYRKLMQKCPWIDEVQTDGRPADIRAFVGLMARLRRARYQRVYDLQANDRTNLYFQALRPLPPPWSGMAFGCALPHRNPARMSMHTLERQAQQLEDAGIWPGAPTLPGEAPAPEVGWMIDAPVRAVQAPLALLVPGASARRPLKRWPAARYGDLARELLDQGFEVAVIGGESEKDLAAIIEARAPASQDLTGRTDLAQIAALGARASVAVGNDTGPLHLIAAAGAPTVALFSSQSDPDLCAPRGQVTVLRADLLETLDTQRVKAAALALAGSRPKVQP